MPKQSPPHTQQQPLSWEEHTRRYPDTFIATVDHDLAAQKQRVEQAGLAADLAAIRAAVDQNLPPGDYTLRVTGATAAVLRRQRVDTVAQRLVEIGYRASDVEDSAKAADLVRTAARVYTGGDEKGDAARIAPIVLLAEFLEVVTEPARTDGPRFSSILYRVLEPLKNAPAAGTVLRVAGGPVHYPDGTMSMSTSDLEQTRPGRYVLFLASPLPGPTSVPDRHRSIFSTMRERNGQFVPTGDSSMPETTLEELRAVIREQMCRTGTAREC